ncbi:hypothetical protein P4H42_21520 [Paenibacillus macerans]|nr:hypothetical protein [Paenibacillus macerans]MEC0332180.1 hypothetical protein [Paenibacillus macerans]
MFDLLFDEVGTLDWLVALQQFLLLFFLGPAKNAGYRPQRIPEAILVKPADFDKVFCKVYDAPSSMS